MNVNAKGSELKECVLVFGVGTRLNGWNWAGLVVARLSMGVSEGRKQEHDVDLQCTEYAVLGLFRGPTNLSRPIAISSAFLPWALLVGSGSKPGIPRVSSLCSERYGMALIRC